MDGDENQEPGPVKLKRNFNTNRRAEGDNWRRPRQDGRPPQQNEHGVRPGPGPARVNTHARTEGGNWRRPRHDARPAQQLDNPELPRPNNRGRSMGPVTSRHFANNQQPHDGPGNPPRRRGVSRDDQRRDFNSDQRNRGRDRYQHMGYLILERVAKSNPSDVFLKLNEHRAGFMELLNSTIRTLDMFALIFEVLSKVSQSPLETMKSGLILDVCNSNFISCVRNYLTDLPFANKEQKDKNKQYWNDQNQFWSNFITFCQDIVDISPATAVRTCRALIESISKTCLEYLNQRHSFTLLEEDALRLEELRNKLINYADKPQIKVNEQNVDGRPHPMNDADIKPPEDFRELSVIPTREDLLDEQPFIRPNIVNGAYSDVEHYLDIQFRLLREDCFGPVRVGVNQYLADPTKRKFDNIRIFRNVKFVGPYVSNFKVGTLVQIDIESNKNLKKINWAHSKRLLYGSLLLFTKNNFSEFIVATISDRDNVLLASGKLSVSIIDASFGGNVHFGEESYTMIESEVYFEPYLHVLTALQATTFPKDLPMQQYIVEVNPSTAPPAYLTPDKQFIIGDETETEELLPTISIFENEFKKTSTLKFTVLDPTTWPTKDDLKLNESQYEAYKLALTHEFAVIQGPPGTGKTYVGLSVAKALLQNVESNKECLMLVICYTNHALDQFLEEISKVTQKIVRIGGQSRNKSMDRFNLSSLRKVERGSKINSYFIETKTNLKQSIGDFQESLLLLDILNYGIVNHELISDHVPQVQLLCDYYYEKYPSIEDPLMHWLFANHTEYYTDLQTCLAEYENLIIDNNDNEYNNMRTDYNIMLDEDNQKKGFLESCKKRMASFYVTDSKLALKKLVGEYLNTDKTFKDKVHAEMEITQLQSMINLYSDMIRYRTREIHLNLSKDTDFSRIAPRVRWQLYFMWIRNIEHKTKKKVEDFENVVSPLISTYEETRMLMDTELIKNKSIKVLGLTTSGAARMRKLINSVSPKIVIVEEAAEVLEQHIITSLTKSCQHLILIGDHQQLRPSASYLKLAKHYNIEVSLFERMITNGIHSRRLSVQHRMRPEIAALISPHIYPELANHPSVETFSNVPGLEKNVFFFSHEHPEEISSNDSTTRANHIEGDLTLALANYLIQQGYKSDEVTILAAYSGQMFYMRKERQKYACLKDVKITVVDNYQGEESRIILLSLVRNNPDNIIGFLGTENRICVALSRAKQGFYMFGNINMLKTKSELWRNIAATLESNGSVGPVLNLKCQVHPDQITPIVNLEDFHKVPEGGCLRKCNYMYACGHHCLLYCHGYDREHIETKCLEPCERVLCHLGHVCPLKCYKDCEECKVYVRKTLPCGHEMEVFCHREPEDPKNKCLTKIEVVLPQCGHKVQKQCYMDTEKVKCTVKCKQRLEDCGHACERNCHVAYPDHKDYVCLKDCARKNKGCLAESVDDIDLHQCKKKCYEQCNDCNVQVTKKRSTCKHVVRIACSVNIEAIPCEKKCARTMACGHFCKNKCSEPCGNCKTMVTKSIPDCNHKIKVECQATVSRKDCTEKCKRTLRCGHPCKAACRALCDETLCQELVSTEVDSPCGHKVKLPCNMYTAFTKGEMPRMKLLDYCRSPCGVELACKHLCMGSCSQCHQGRLHAPCKQKCNQINICGHQCQEPCNQICPPCNMLCEVQCQHSRCSRMCGEPCVECKEKCNRRCPHGSCTRLCSQPCSRQPCAQPCARALACGHRCRGVCGEPCPDVCRICRPDDFPVDFLGDEYGEDEKFILLEDCGHVLELENMDNLMMGDQENIKIRTCPFCRKPIINTNRYKDLVNNMFKNEINPIKERVYGKNTEIDTKLKELKMKVEKLYAQCRQEHKGLAKSILEFVSFMKSRKKMYLLQVEMLLIYCDIIEMIAERWKTFRNIKNRILNEEMEKNILIILKILKVDPKSKVSIKISEQQQRDVGNEIKRLNAIIQLANLLQIDNSIKSDPDVKNSIEKAKSVVLTIYAFDEDKAFSSLKALQTSLKSNNTIILKMERQMIIKSLGVQAGTWYKCPNGHFYTIGNCGQAVQQSKCPDCGAVIGGIGYRLADNNVRISAPNF